MKQKAKESIMKVLTKVCSNENIDIDLNVLTDIELKKLYLKLQFVKSGRLPYGIGKGEDFTSTMENGKLNPISFRDSYKYGLRRLTFREYLQLCEFVAKNPGVYRNLE